MVCIIHYLKLFYLFFLFKRMKNKYGCWTRYLHWNQLINMHYVKWTLLIPDKISKQFSWITIKFLPGVWLWIVGGISIVRTDLLTRFFIYWIRRLSTPLSFFLFSTKLKWVAKNVSLKKYKKVKDHWPMI